MTFNVIITHISMLDEEVTRVETQTGNERYFHNSHYTEVSLGSSFQHTGKYRSSWGETN